MIKKVWGMYFTGTGTTEKVVTHIGKKIAEKLGVEYEDYDFTLPKVRKVEKSFIEEDLVVFGTPVIAGRVPNLLLKYLDLSLIHISSPRDGLLSRMPSSA